MINKITKIKIKIDSFNYEQLIFSCNKIINIVQNVANSTSVVALPSHKRIYCVLRSPHVNKASREHFQLKTHKRLLQIYHDSELDVFSLLSNLEVPPGVFYRICIL
jgi:small subunit ribosomal protein S10